MTSSATLSAKHNLKQCHVINLNLTNAQTLLSKKLTLTANNNTSAPSNDKMSAEIFADTDEEYISAKTVQKKSLTGSKTNSFESSDKNKNLMNFQTTLRTYCLSDCDYLNRQKKQRLKNFNAKIRHSIKNQMKKRSNDSRYLQNLEKSRETPDSPEYLEPHPEPTLEKSKTVQHLKEVNHIERRKSTNELPRRKPSPIQDMNKSSPYTEAFKRIGSIHKETNSKDLLLKVTEGELAASLNGKYPAKNPIPSLFNKSSNQPTESRPLSSKSMKIINSSRLDYSAVNSNKITTGAATEAAAVTEQIDPKCLTKTKKVSSLLAHNELASSKSHAATTAADINNVLEIKQHNFTSKSLNKLDATSSNDKGLHKNLREDPTLKETLSKLKNFDVDTNKSGHQIEYEILEELLVNDLEDKHHLPSSINELKNEFEKKLKAKKLLIQNLNLNQTIDVETTIECKQAQATNKILSSKKTAATATKVGVSDHSSTSKQNGSSGPQSNTTRNGNHDFVKSQAVRKKLIFKRNFSDESDHNSKTNNHNATTVKIESSNDHSKPDHTNNNQIHSVADSSADDALTTKSSNKDLQEYSNESIQRVYEKTKILIRNFYKNFDLMNENQQKLENQIQIETQNPDTTNRINSISLQQSRPNTNINSLLTNTPYTPHWFNIATMGTNYNSFSSKSAKTANRIMTRESRGNEEQQKSDTTPSVYLYSSIPSMNKKNQQQQHNQIDKTPDTKEAKPNNSRGLKLSTLKKDGQIEQLASSKNIVMSKENTTVSNTDDSIPLRKESISPISASNDHNTNKSPSSIKPLLSREKQKLLSLNEAQNDAQNIEQNESDDQELKLPELTPKSRQRSDISMMSTEESFDRTTAAVSNQQHQSSTPQQQHQSRQQSKPVTAVLTGQNYVLAQMSKYQRNNSVNLLNFSSNKLFVTNNGSHGNNFMSSGVFRPKGSLLKQKEPPLSDVDPPKHTFNGQILCRGNTLITRELSHHVLNQQQKIKTLDTQGTPAPSGMQQQTQPGPQASLNTSKAKLSQIQSKPKSSLITSKNTEPSNKDNSNDMTVGSATSRATIESSQKMREKVASPQPEFHSLIQRQAEKKAAELEAIKFAEKIRSTDEPLLTKPKGLYTYAVTSSCQLRESFYNNRSLINTSSNSTNLLIYNRSDTYCTNEELKEEITENEAENVTMSTQTLPQIEEIKNTKKNRKAFKDLDFIYNEQQVFKLSRQIWFQIRTNKFRTNQNRLNENHLNQYLDQLNNSSMLINKLYNYDVYKFYERAKIPILIKCLTPLKSNFHKNTTSSNNNNNIASTVLENGTNHIIRNINNIANIADKSSPQNSSDGKTQFTVDKDLQLKKDGTSISQVSADVNNVTIDEEDDIDDENDERNERVDRDLLYAELEGDAANDEDKNDPDYSVDEDSNSVKAD